ncbi:hypothetical protein DPEC_G00106660 [Dallia pectoralis]|uniref:Uncharacterized protein n=1 Tax=Dallia pectoralis TaxID=75939 RepID=A0ACC2GXV3_DALPE|nr:hypothetical protein DPEC_G00106660 [Dallia pectoralis]
MGYLPANSVWTDWSTNHNIYTEPLHSWSGSCLYHRRTGGSCFDDSVCGPVRWVQSERETVHCNSLGSQGDRTGSYRFYSSRHGPCVWGRGSGEVRSGCSDCSGSGHPHYSTNRSSGNWTVRTQTTEKIHTEH